MSASGKHVFDFQFHKYYDYLVKKRSEMSVLQDFANKPILAPGEKKIIHQSKDWQIPEKLHGHLCAICRYYIFYSTKINSVANIILLQI